MELLIILYRRSGVCFNLQEASQSRQRVGHLKLLSFQARQQQVTSNKSKILNSHIFMLSHHKADILTYAAHTNIKQFYVPYN